MSNFKQEGGLNQMDNEITSEVIGTRIEIYQDVNDGWRWRLVHSNGNIMADGSEAYATKAGLLKSLANVREYMSEAAAMEIV